MIIFSCTINVKGVFFNFLMYITLKDTFFAVLSVILRLFWCGYRLLSVCFLCLHVLLTISDVVHALCLFFFFISLVHNFHFILLLQHFMI